MPEFRAPPSQLVVACVAGSSHSTLSAMAVAEIEKGRSPRSCVPWPFGPKSAHRIALDSLSAKKSRDPSVVSPLGCARAAFRLSSSCSASTLLPAQGSTTRGDKSKR